MEVDFREYFCHGSSGKGADNGVKACVGGRGAEADIPVTLDEFRGYYRDVGVCEPYDAVFIPVIEVLHAPAI